MKKHSCKDSYEEFLKHFADRRLSRRSFILYGLANIIMVEDDVALAELEKSIEAWKTKGKLYIRRYGKCDPINNPYKKLYKKIWGGEVIQDHDNNKESKERLKKKLLGKYHIEGLINYQYAHVWGKTKNPIMFTALFNIVLIPKMFDPLTGHETKGKFAAEFRKCFKHHIREMFPKSIARYNEFVSGLDIAAKIDNYCKKHECSVPVGFCANAKKEWETIEG